MMRCHVGQRFLFLSAERTRNDERGLHNPLARLGSRRGRRRSAWGEIPTWPRAVQDVAVPDRVGVSSSVMLDGGIFGDDVSLGLPAQCAHMMKCNVHARSF